MPRMRTPDGYYTATQVKNILNISDAMIRQHVEKGRIRYKQPPGRKQGFYLKKDVDRIANALQAFLDNPGGGYIESFFERATLEDLTEIERIAKSLFAPDEENENITNLNNWRTITYRKNPESQYVVRDDQRNVVGYVSFLPLKKGTDKIDKLLSVDLISEVEITEDDIETFERGKHIDLYLGAIGLKPGLGKDKEHYYGAKLISGTANKIVELGERGVIIDTLAALGATHNGRRILQYYGFHEVPPLAEGKRAFKLGIQDSGSTVSMQYKQALEASGVLSKQKKLSKTASPKKYNPENQSTS